DIVLPWIDEISAASEQTRAAGKILSQPEGEEEPVSPIIGEARGRQDHARKDRSRKSGLLVLEEAVLDPELDVAGAAAPGFEGTVGETQGKRRGELNTLHRTVIEIKAGVCIERGFEAFAHAEGVDLPMAGVGGDRIVGEVG